MASTAENVEKLPPPSNLSKENVGVWMGWCCKGDKEVAREAAAKGIAVDMVVSFMSQRKKVGLEEAENYYRDEVFIWVKELLERKQIFRVSHILNNIGVNPQEELSKVFCTTTNWELREYIGNHLKNQNKLDENLQQLWHFLEVMLKNGLLICKWKLDQDSIECLNKQEPSWKAKLAAKLFLRTNDIKLLPFLSGEALWKQLLAYNDIKLVKVWTHIYYNEFYEMFELPDNLLKVFRQFSITEEMVNQLNSPDTSANTSNVILNDLCQFGVFCERDKGDILNVLSRFYNSNNIHNIYQILRKSSCNVREKDFLNQLVNYCIKHKLNRVMSSCIENFDIYEDTIQGNYHLELLSDFRRLTINFEEGFLMENIFKVSQLLSDDLEDYFEKNPLILLSLICLSKDLALDKIIEDKTVNLLGVTLKKSVESLPKRMKCLSAVMSRREIIREKTSFYDLLQKHYNIDVKELYSFQFKNGILPDFNDTYLLEKFGYSKKIDYLFYVKQHRPSVASKLFLMNQYEDFKGFPEDKAKELQRKIFKIAIRDFTDVEIVSSCVAFLEMIGYNSNFIKIAVTSANTLLKNDVQVDKVKEMFLNIENAPTDILSLLEHTVIKNIDFQQFNDGFYFVDSIKIYDIVIDFSICYDLRLPVMFLKKCASNNMWMPFIIFAQLKNYPIEQIKPVLQSFKNPNLLEHLHHSVVNDIDVDDSNVLMRERDSRNYFLSRIGVRKSLENVNQNDSMTSQSSYGSINSNSSGSDFLEIDISNTKATLLQTLIRCHNSTDPPRALLQACQLYKNPILAIFATSYEPDSLITNWLTWLAVSSGLYEVFTNFESVASNSHSVSNLLNNCIKHRFPATLLQSFEIFIPTNPLRYFVEFVNLCIYRNPDIAALTAKLDAFKTSIGQCRRFSVIVENDHEMTYLDNKIWLKNTALELLSSTIQCLVDSLHEQLQLLETLNLLNIDNYIDCPDFKSFLAVLRIVYESNSEVGFDVGLFLDKDERKAIDDCVNAFLDNFQFDCALEIAEIRNLPSDNILIKQWEYKFENKDSGDVEFWSKCNEEFELRNLSADGVVNFFLDHLSRVETTIEKYELLKFAHKWSTNNDLPSKYDLEKEKWLAYVTLEEKWRCFDSTISEESLRNVPFTEMLQMLDQMSTHKNKISSETVNILNTVINDALNNGNVWLALKLEKIFDCNNSNLDILKLCYSLAEGLIQPYQLSAEQRLILSKGRLSNRRNFLSARISGYSSPSPSPASSSYLHSMEAIDGPLNDTLAAVGSLAEKVTSGVDIAQAIFMTYRISINIEIPYHVIVSNGGDSMKMLKDALEDNCLNKLEVVHDFICIYKWSKDQIADFICEEIVTSATKYVKSWSEEYVMWDLKMDQDYHLILQLLQDNCSVLGYKLYAFASVTHKSQVLADLDFRINKLALVIELLITAHDCFTADCNMEGISLILKKCQTVISHLLLLRSWKLIVRLLTGVGRYTEMNYVFQILRENDQFEFLLRKGSRKDNGLKTALLEYLKKYCPDNKELYKIVALHFTLFTEVAALWEREAHYIINNLIEIAKLEMLNSKLDPNTEPFVLLSNTDGTKLCLNKAIENYTHATEFHLQGEKLSKAMNSAKQAELIALQISLLKGLHNNAIALCVLNLTSTQINHLITHHLSFEQSSILVQAYNHQPDWSSVLFTQFVIQNDGNYFRSFLKHRSLTDSLVNDISRKFLTAKINTVQEINNMKTILNELPSVHTKYRIASELSFVDVVEELIESDQLAFLKDTVWKKGYKN